MNLLDDPNNLGLMSLGLRLMSTPGKFGPALGQAGLGAMGDIQQAKAAQQVQQQRALQQRMLEMQMQQLQQEQARRQGVEGAYRGAFESPATQAMAGGGGPTVENAEAMNGMQPRVNQQKLIQALSRVDPMAAYKMMQPKASDYKVVGDSLVEIGGGGVKEAYRAPQKPDAAPSSVREFQYGQQNPEFSRWLEGQNRAKGTQVSVAGAKYQDAFDVANAKNFADSFGQINTTGMQASQTIANLDRMEQLLQGVDGGRFAPAGKEVASMAESFGIRLDPKLGNKEAAEALAVEMALAMRPPGSGPMTDKDFSNFLMTVPGLSKTPQGRAQITATVRAKAQRDERMADLAQQYVDERGRLDSGFYKVAREFIARNPVVKSAAPPQAIPSMSDIEAELRKRGK